jgi:hypothetical protein
MTTGAVQLRTCGGHSVGILADRKWQGIRRAVERGVDTARAIGMARRLVDRSIAVDAVEKTQLLEIRLPFAVRADLD